jgi:hypothetical protein
MFELTDYVPVWPQQREAPLRAVGYQQSVTRQFQKAGDLLVFARPLAISCNAPKQPTGGIECPNFDWGIVGDKNVAVRETCCTGNPGECVRRAWTTKLKGRWLPDVPRETAN